MTGAKTKFWVIGFNVILVGLLLCLLWGRWQVSAIRFFDVDEFSYMHWAAQVARGERMYVDIFSYFTPGFMWAFAPIFWFYGVSVQVFTAGRQLSFVIFLGILGSLGYLWGITRGWKWALLPVVILAFLPMPYDKFLEIRPDNLAILLGIMGVIGEIRGLQTKKNIWWLMSGLAYSASLFVLTKTLPIVAVGGAVALISSGKDWKKNFYFISGLFLPWVLFFLEAAVGGHFGNVWYSLTKLPFEAYKSAEGYAMEADLFFFPNIAFYGLGQGITTGLIVNHIIWILGILVGALRVVTPYREGSKEKASIELLIGIIFFLLVYGYVKYFPAKHTQYLIPIAVFVAYYAADGLSTFFDWLTRTGGYESMTILLLGFAYLLITTIKEVNAPKLFTTNTVQFTELSILIKTIPLSARVVDMEGRMLFWPDGYPASSLPFDALLQKVTRSPLPLAAYLQQHSADYIYQGDSGRMSTFTAENFSYIQTHFAPVPGFGEKLWKRK